MQTSGGAFDLDAVIGGMMEEQRRKDASQRPVVDLSASSVYVGGAKTELSQDHEKILQSYVEIPRGAWGNIPLNTYVRYVTKNNELKTGARVRGISSDMNDGYTIELRKLSRGRKTLVWTANTKNISKIYRIKDEKKFPTKANQHSNAQSNQQPNAQSNQRPNSEMQALSRLGDSMLFDNASTISNRLDMLEARSQRIEHDLKRLFMLIKRELSQKRL